MYHPEEFVKLTNENNINRDFEFKEGLNEDIYELNENDEYDENQWILFRNTKVHYSCNVNFK